MLPLLTQYLFQYKTVGIPHVGTILLIEHPAQAEAVDRKVLPPAFIVELKTGEDVSDHQVNFLDGFLNSGRDAVLQELKFFGSKLSETINGPGLEWKGLGLISSSTQTLSLATPALQPVPAAKVIRADAQHALLVGDQEMTSARMEERREGAHRLVKKRSVVVLLGWVLLVTAVLIIALFLYAGKFRVNAAGSRHHLLGHHQTLFIQDAVS